MYCVFYRHGDNMPWRCYAIEEMLTDAVIAKEELICDGYDSANIQIGNARSQQ